MNPSYRFESLSDSIKVCVSPEHRFGTDAFLLANFAAPRHKDIVCDLGTGCGIIPMALAKNYQPKQIVGVDIQQQAIEQFQLSIEHSDLEESITAIHADLKDIVEVNSTSLTPHSFDVVTCNPPYKAGNTGILSELTAEQIARHEVLCTIDDVCKAAGKLLKYGGRLCLCQRPERLADVITAMKNANIEPKRLRFVAKNSNTAPWLFLIEGKKHSKPFLKVEPLLVVQSENGFSEELLKIYGFESN